MTHIIARKNGEEYHRQIVEADPRLIDNLVANGYDLTISTDEPNCPICSEMLNRWQQV